MLTPNPVGAARGPTGRVDGRAKIPTMEPTYCPSGGSYRRAIYAAAARFDLRSLLQLALALVRECEYLRTWARQNGMNPPRFEATTEHAAILGAELVPVADAVTRSRIGAAGAELVPAPPRSRSLVQRGA